MLLPKIDDLIRCDRANEPLTKQMLDEYDSDFLDIVQEIGSLFETVPRVFIQGQGNHLDRMAGIAEKLHVEPAALFEIADHDKNVEKEVARFHSSQMRIRLIMRLGILHAQIFADFLRLRITSPLALMRLQVESLAVISIVSAEPRIATEWTAVGFDKRRGRKFHQKYHAAKIIPELRRLGLYDAYDMSSGIAVHSRSAGLALGTKAVHESLDETYRYEIKSTAQEFDAEDPAPFISTVIHATVIQERVLAGLVDSVDEMDDGILVAIKLPKLNARVRALSDRHLSRSAHRS